MADARNVQCPRLSWRVSLVLLAGIYWRVWGIGIPLVLALVAIQIAIKGPPTPRGAYLVGLVTGNP